MGNIELPLISIIIPTHNSGRLISHTLESLNSQDYPNVEVIMVDAGSTDPTIDFAQRTYNGEVRVYSVTGFNPAEMYNRGISLARGQYVTILYPGDTYVALDSLKQMGELVVAEEFPELAYCGSLMRDEAPEPVIRYRHLSVSLLRRGFQPTTLMGCWLRIDALRKLGKLDSNFPARYGFDLFCRISKKKDWAVASINRVLIDFQRPGIPPALALQRGWESQKIVRKHFGLRWWLQWWLSHHPISFLHLWWKTSHSG